MSRVEFVGYGLGSWFQGPGPDQGSRVWHRSRAKGRGQRQCRLGRRGVFRCRAVERAKTSLSFGNEGSGFVIQPEGLGCAALMRHA
eukprot:220562-Rhodomonas_salina.1